MMCILNHHTAHIYLCGEVRRTVYGQNIWNLCGQIYIPLSGTTEKYTNNIQNLCGQRYVPLSEPTGKYSEFMRIEIHSIIWEISIPMFSLCDKNITNDT